MIDSEKPYIDKALASVIQQTEPCDILLFVEKHNQWIDVIVSRYPEVQVRKVELLSAGTIRNIGVVEARTEFVAFLDGDDYWSPTKIEKQLKIARETRASFVGADHILVRDDETPIGFGTARFIPMPSSWFVHRETMLALPFPESPICNCAIEDGLWWTHPDNRFRKYRLSEFLIYYRVRSSSLSSNIGSKRKKELTAHLSRIFPLRYFILSYSYFLHWLYKRNFYQAPVHLPWSDPALSRWLPARQGMEERQGTAD